MPCTYTRAPQHHQPIHQHHQPTKQPGIPHPDAVVENASLAAIRPPQPAYQLSLPREVVEEGRLSALQLETVLLASQRHATLLPPDGARGGFFIGDGAGVGKGRQLAGLIYENWMKGRRRHIWVSTSSDLRIDAARDLADVVGDDRIPVIELSQQYGPMPPEGVVFLTYSKLAAGRQGGGGQLRSRFDQLLAWATRRGKETFDGCLLFDESHRAKALFVGSGTQSQAALVRLGVLSCGGDCEDRFGFR